MSQLVNIIVVLCFCIAATSGQTNTIGQLRKSCGTWGPWQNWGDCSRTCGGGTRTRVHVCQRNATDTTRLPLYCFGSASQSENCNTAPCANGLVNGNWGPWSAWTEPTITCSNNQVVDVRTRRCNNPAPSMGGAACVGQNLDRKIYPLPSCNGNGETPINGNWGPWSRWTDPTITCSNTQVIDTRTRRCNNPAPSNGGRPCTGPDSDRKVYPLPRCR